MCNDPELEVTIKNLGGTICTDVANCTVLIAKGIQRTKKLLEAVGQGKPICSKTWIYESKKAQMLLGKKQSTYIPDFKTNITVFYRSLGLFNRRSRSRDTMGFFNKRIFKKKYK